MACLTHRFARIAGLFALALYMALPAAAETVSSIRIMLSPSVAPRGVLPSDALARLETLAGTTLALTGTTRTGALDFAIGTALDQQAAATLVRQLRNDRSVLWVEPQWPARITAKAAIADPRAHLPGRRLLVRLNDDAAPDWAALLD